MLDEWDRGLTRLTYRTTVLILEMMAANGRHDGRRLEYFATPIVDELLLLKLKTAVLAAGRRHGADALLRDLLEIGADLSNGLACLASDVTAPDANARDWLRKNGGRLECAFTAARLAHMAGTAMKMNAVENFAELSQMARRPDLRDFEGTSEDIAIKVMSVKARGA